jgi:hypothetical protein
MHLRAFEFQRADAFVVSHWSSTLLAVVVSLFPLPAGVKRGVPIREVPGLRDGDVLGAAGAEKSS